MDLGSALVLAACAALLLVALEGIRHLGRVRRKGTEDPVALHGAGFSLDLPPWWHVVGSGKSFTIDTRDHDGCLRLAAGHQDGLTPAQAMTRLMKSPGLDVDDAEVVAFAAGPYTGAHAQSRVAIADSNQVERSYRAWWVLDGPDVRLTAVYGCSVLYGLVDGVYLDAAMRSVRFGRHSAAENLEQSAPIVGRQG